MLTERLVGKVTKENLWLFILALLYEKPHYGYELRARINERFGFWSGNVTAYRVLYSLTKAGLVELEEREVSGRIRKYYGITTEGKKEYSNGKKALSQIISSLP